MYQPKTGVKCHCKPGMIRDNCAVCEGTGQRIDFAAIRAATKHKSQYTPGPWAVHVGPNGPTWTIKDSQGRAIAEAERHTKRLGTGVGAANARLIASAPALLEAIQATLKPLIRLGDFIGNEDKGGISGLGAFDRCAIIGQVRDAISQATQSEGSAK